VRGEGRALLAIRFQHVSLAIKVINGSFNSNLLQGSDDLLQHLGRIEVGRYKWGHVGIFFQVGRVALTKEISVQNLDIPLTALDGVVHFSNTGR